MVAFISNRFVHLSHDLLYCPITSWMTAVPDDQYSSSVPVILYLVPYTVTPPASYTMVS